MLSTAILLLAWWAAATWLVRLERFSSDLLPITSYAFAFGSLNIVYFCSLSLLHGLRAQQAVAVLLPLACASYVLFNKKSSCTALMSLRRFLFPGRIQAAVANDSPVHGLAQTLFVVRNCFTALSIGILTLSTFLITTVSNPDSLSYNLARTAGFLIHNTPFLPATGTPRQAVLPFAHDILYLPDLAIGNLRGLGGVSTIEFVLLLGCILQTTRIISGLHSFAPKRAEVGVQCSLLLASTLLISSDLQIFQAGITKNDLIITLFFMATLFISLATSVETARHFSPSVTVSVIALMTAVAVSSKNYGFIVCIPPLVTMMTPLGQRIRSQFRSSRTWFSCNLKAVDALRSPHVLFPALLTLALIAIGGLLHNFVFHNYLSEIKEMQSTWANSSGPIGDRSVNWLLTMGRVITMFSFYPYSTIDNPSWGNPPWFTGQSDHPSIRWLATILEQKRGLGSDLPFTLSPRIHPDFAYTSPLFHLFLGLSLLYFISRLLSWIIRPQQGKSSSDFQSATIIILASCVFSFAVTCYFILYQPWFGRFIGPAYVPLIPLLSIWVTRLILNGIDSRYILIRFIYRAAFFLLLTLAVVYSLRRVTYLTGIQNSVTDLSRPQAAVTQQAGSVKANDSQALAYINHIHKINKIPKDEAIRFTHILQTSDFKQRVLCFQDNDNVLYPMMATLANPAYRDGSTTLDSETNCRVVTKIQQNLSSPSGGNHLILKKNEKYYFFLP